MSLKFYASSISYSKPWAGAVATTGGHSTPAFRLRAVQLLDRCWALLRFEAASARLWAAARPSIRIAGVWVARILGAALRRLGWRPSGSGCTALSLLTDREAEGCGTSVNRAEASGWDSAVEHALLFKWFPLRHHVFYRCAGYPDSPVRHKFSLVIAEKCSFKTSQEHFLATFKMY